MSIIIGNLGTLYPYFLGDTFTTENESNTSLTDRHCLKTHILSKNICVAFAGKVAPALDAIAALYDKIVVNEELPSPQIELFNIWTNISNGHDLGRSEFLIIWKDSDTFRGARIGSTIQNFSNGYTGSNVAFAEFQRLKALTPPYQHHIEEIVKRETDKVAFKALLDSNIDPTIGHLSGFPMAAEYDSDYGFMFPIASYMSNDPAAGANQHAVCTTLSGRGAVGLYYTGSRCGFLFISGEASRVKMIENVTFEQFKIEALNRYEITLIGSIWEQAN